MRFGEACACQVRPAGPAAVISKMVHHACRRRPSLKTFHACVQRLERELVAGAGPAGTALVVVDSVAALARPETGGAGLSSMVARAEALGRLAVRLKALAGAHALAVVVTNQASAALPCRACMHACIS